MCLILFAYRVHPGYQLVMAGNRDEFYERPTEPVAFWNDAPDVLAGRDLQAGGAWLGVTRTGRFAAITNYRDPKSVRADTPSRGDLVSNYLKSQDTPQEYLEQLAPYEDNYNGFNLLVGDTQGLFYYSNYHRAGPKQLVPGYYGLSNHLLDSPWPKVERGKHKLQSLLNEDGQPQTEDLFTMLEDRTQAADEDLPNTGVSLEWERLLSPLFIESPHYGTRSSTVLQVDANYHVEITEKTWVDRRVRHFRLQWPRVKLA
jgi:uncharacterized protein with NRDE domain